jgi:hypothetical protein
MRQKIDAAMRELALHGREVYDHHAALLQKFECYGYEFLKYDIVIEKYFDYKLYDMELE